MLSQWSEIQKVNANMQRPYVCVRVPLRCSPAITNNSTTLPTIFVTLFGAHGTEYISNACRIKKKDW